MPKFIALSFASCSDINDIDSEGYRITGEQIDDATSVIPSRLEAKIAGMYSSMGTVCAAFPSDTRDDDGGYPTVCLSQDLNGPDMELTLQHILHQLRYEPELCLCSRTNL